MVRAAVGLGSNLGDRAGTLATALAGLAALPYTRLVAVSDAWETEPWGVEDQPPYLNAVAVLDTELAPEALLAALLRLERAAGRIREVRWSARTLDLDVLLFGDRVIDAPDLIVPHPRLVERRFALVPLLQVWPDAVDPRTGTPLAEALARCPDTCAVVRLHPLIPAGAAAVVPLPGGGYAPEDADVRAGDPPMTTPPRRARERGSPADTDRGRPARRATRRMEIGPFEVPVATGRRPPTPVEAQVTLWLGARPEGRRPDGRVAEGIVRFLLRSGPFASLEAAAEAVARVLLAPPLPDEPPAEAVTSALVTLARPDVRVTVERAAAELAPGVEHKPFGRVDVLYEDEVLGVYRLRVAPGRAIPTHEHRQMDERELVLGSGLLLQGRPVAAGTALHWPRHFPHRYDNPTPVEQAILCVNRPAFLPHDEVEVPPPSGGLAPVSGERCFGDEAAPASPRVERAR